MSEVGATLLTLAAASRREFVMCAPFAKQSVVSRVIAAVPANVELVLYTRWRPEEIAAGVSDTGVLELLRSRGGSVFLHDRLHAKFFRNESDVLLGSANLTAKALGWTPEANIELLVASSHGYVTDIECLLKSESIAATDDLAREMEDLAALLPAQASPSDLDGQTEAQSVWVPRLRIPSDLFTAYSEGVQALSRRSADAAAFDLAVLDIPPGLNLDQFRAVVGSRLRHQTLIAKLDRFLEVPRRFGEVRQLIGETTGLDRKAAEEAWQTTMRWLLEYLPDRYSHNVFRHSEVLSRSEVE